MSQGELSSIDEILEPILADENTSAIVTTLRLYAPLNLKSIAKLLDKAESTLHRHMSKLRDMDLVKQDTTVSRPGKYYRLDPAVLDYFTKKLETAMGEFEEDASEIQELFHKIEQGQSPENEEAKRELIDKFTNSYQQLYRQKDAIEAAFTVNRNIQSLVLQQLLNKGEDDELTIDNIEEFISDPQNIGGLNHLALSTGVTSHQDLFDIVSALVTFVKKIGEVDRRVKARKQKNPDLKITNYYTYLFSGALRDEIDETG